MPQPLPFALRTLTHSPLWAILAGESAAALLLLQQGRADSDTWEAAKPSVTGTGPHKIAVVPIQGVLTKDGPAWYGSNYDTISQAVESAADNPDIKHIVLTVNSPGGAITGLPEAAAAIAKAATIKPVTAMVEGMSASAAYWLTSQANDVVLTPSGEVGSIGVRMMHMDISKMMENFGISVTELHAGEYKTEWSPYHPLSDEAKADMQPRLDTARQEFIGSVQSSRGDRLSADVKGRNLGEGRMFQAPEAVTHGLVDKVASARDFFKSLAPQAETTSTLHLRHELETARIDSGL